MRIANIIVFAIIFGAITAPTLAQQSRSKDTIEFNPLAAVRKQHLTRAYLNTQSCLHRLLEAQLYSLEPRETYRSGIYAIVLKMAGEELASILARGR
jgi:hypothetical protein